MMSDYIGRRLYRKSVTPVYSPDKSSYTCGCIVTRNDGSVSVRFFEYKTGGWIIGRCKPTNDLVSALKRYGQELKTFVLRMNDIEMRSIERSDRHPPPLLGSVKPRLASRHDCKGLRN